MIVLLLHLIKETKGVSIIYAIILSFGILQLTGSVFKALHWPFSGVMLLIGFAGAIVTALTFVSTSLKNETKSVLVLQLLLGITLLLQCALAILSSAVALSYGSYFNYPVLALSATILFNRTYLNNGERNILLLVLMQALFFLFKFASALV